MFLALLVHLSACYGRPRKIEDEKPTEGLIQLDHANFLGTLAELAQSYDWVLVEFYSHWCPACKAFQPDYKKVATHINHILQEEDRFWAEKAGDRPSRIAVARIDCPENKQLCDDFEISKYPTMLLDKPVHFSSKTLDNLVEIEAKPRNKNTVIAKLEQTLGRTLDQPMFQKENSPWKLESFDEDQDIRDDDKSDTRSDDENETVGREVDPDIIGATIESFEYLKSRPLLKGQPARRALVSWLRLIAVSHMTNECRIGAQNALTTLDLAWPESTNEIQDMDSFQNVRICGKTKQSGWISCQGSSKDSRGYTCGLWMLLHSLSVRMPEVSENVGQEWLTVIKEFVQFFFQCKDCAEHFLKELDGFEAKLIISKRDAVLWLWKTHNKVNKRLYQEQDVLGNGDPNFPHVQWPTKDICGNCHPESKWNEENVYDFLHRYYKGESMQKSGLAGNENSVSRQATSQESSWKQVSFIVVGVFASVYYYLRPSKQYTVSKSMRYITKD